MKTGEEGEGDKIRTKQEEEIVVASGIFIYFYNHLK